MLAVKKARVKKVKSVAVKLGKEGLRVEDVQPQPVVAVVPVVAGPRRVEYSSDYERNRLGVSGERLIMAADMYIDEWQDMVDMHALEGYLVEGLLYPNFGTDRWTVAVQGLGVIVASSIVPQKFPLLLRMSPPEGSDSTPRLACPCGWSTEAVT